MFVIMFSMAMTQNGVTALNFASQEGHVTVVKLLLEKEADVNLCDKVVINFFYGVNVYVGVQSVCCIYALYVLDICRQLTGEVHQPIVDNPLFVYSFGTFVNFYKFIYSTISSPASLTLACAANLRHACAVRVTVVGAVCVCACVCVSIKSHLTYGASVCPENAVTYSAGNEGKQIVGICLKRLCSRVMPRNMSEKANMLINLTYPLSAFSA